jgi:hypothetical protein
MSKFMFVYRGGHERMEQASPEQMQQVMQMWMDWIQAGTEAGWMLDGGDALKPGGAIVNADLSVTDGPFAESKELVGGYTIVEANDLAAACELAKRTMKLAGGGKIEVREFANVGQLSAALMFLRFVSRKRAAIRQTFEYRLKFGQSL